MKTLIDWIKKKAPQEGDFPTAFHPLSFHRRNQPTSAIPCIYPLGIALTIQGQKQVLLHEQMYTYQAGQSLVISEESPAISYITEASKETPYLGLYLRLEHHILKTLATEMQITPLKENSNRSLLSIQALEPELLDAVMRLVRLLDRPDQIPFLGPLLHQEIIIRLLTGPHSIHLSQFAVRESSNQQVERVIVWLKHNFTQNIRIPELAQKIHMSVSSFRQHFRSITGMSPLQFQKHLRLEEAKKLMLHRHLDVSQASLAVGYESLSQFSREYSRKFGLSPQKDIQRILSLSI